MSTNRRTFMATAALGFFGIVRAGSAGERHGVKRSHARVKEWCSLPPYGYVPSPSALPALALSQTAVLIRGPAVSVVAAQSGSASEVGSTAQFYQLKQNVLPNGHCSISRVALTIGSGGYWRLSLRADQNPVALNNPGPVVAASPAPRRRLLPGSTADSRYTAHIKRNLFMVPVRGYGAFGTEANPDASPGRPLLFEVNPPPFWVERGVPLFPTFEGNDWHIREFFASIDRVEIELTYR